MFALVFDFGDWLWNNVTIKMPSPRAETFHDAMKLATIDVPAFTFTPADVTVTREQTQRFTMKDIGKLQNRIENLEYYTSLNLLERRAGLVPFMFNGPIKEISDRLSGVSLEVEVSCKNQKFLENLLFTHRGISGPSILQISSYWSPGDAIIVNLLPNHDAQLLLMSAKKQKEGLLLRTYLSSLIPKALVLELQNLWWPNFSDKPLAELSNKLLSSIGSNLNAWKLKPSETEGYRTAEVTLGGINTNDISSKTMESNDHPGLYFVGEVLDVSGHLGGFNFQWAWASGYTAGLFV